MTGPRGVPHGWGLHPRQCATPEQSSTSCPTPKRPPHLRRCLEVDEDLRQGPADGGETFQGSGLPGHRDPPRVLQAYADGTGADVPPVHDPCVVAYVSDSTPVTTQEAYVSVTEGHPAPTSGRLAWDGDAE